jgi:hypothetical protein
VEDAAVRRLSNLFFLMALMLLGMTLFAVAARVGESGGGVAGSGKDAGGVESFETVRSLAWVDLAVRSIPAILRR